MTKMIAKIPAPVMTSLMKCMPPMIREAATKTVKTSGHINNNEEFLGYFSYNSGNRTIRKLQAASKVWALGKE